MPHRDVPMSRDDCMDAGGRATPGAVAGAGRRATASAIMSARIPAGISHVHQDFRRSHAGGHFRQPVLGARVPAPGQRPEHAHRPGAGLAHRAVADAFYPAHGGILLRDHPAGGVLQYAKIAGFRHAAPDILGRCSGNCSAVQGCTNVARGQEPEATRRCSRRLFPTPPYLLPSLESYLRHPVRSPATALPLASRDGVMPREGRDGPERLRPWSRVLSRQSGVCLPGEGYTPSLEIKRRCR